MSKRNNADIKITQTEMIKLLMIWKYVDATTKYCIVTISSSNLRINKSPLFVAYIMPRGAKNMTIGIVALRYSRVCVL